MHSMSAIDDTLVRRRVLSRDSLRMLVNIELRFHTECHGVRVRRIIVTEPDVSGCNWQPEWPPFRAAMAEPCRSEFGTVVEHLRERYNVLR
jgi:hypothetical protein